MKPVPAPAMPRFRLHLVAAALLLSSVLFPGEAGAEWGLDIHAVRRLRHRRQFYGTTLPRRSGRTGGWQLRTRPRPAGHPGNPVRTFLRAPADEGHRRGTFGGETLFDLDIPLPSPGGDVPVYRGEGPPLPFRGLAQRTLCRMGADWTGKRTSPSRWAGASRYRSRSRRSSLRGEGVHDAAGLTEIFCVSSGGATCNVKVQGTCSSGPADGGDHLFIVRKAMADAPASRQRSQSPGEEIANSVSHAVGLAAALAATPVLVHSASGMAAQRGLQARASLLPQWCCCTSHPWSTTRCQGSRQGSIPGS